MAEWLSIEACDMLLERFQWGLQKGWVVKLKVMTFNDVISIANHKIDYKKMIMLFSNEGYGVSRKCEFQ